MLLKLEDCPRKQTLLLKSLKLVILTPLLIVLKNWTKELVLIPMMLGFMTQLIISAIISSIVVVEEMQTGRCFLIFKMIFCKYFSFFNQIWVLFLIFSLELHYSFPILFHKTLLQARGIMKSQENQASTLVTFPWKFKIFFRIFFFLVAEYLSSAI